MQSKIIAAAVAGTAAAIKLEAPTTMLAQAAPLDPRAGVETDCHGTYMYQCMQVKVDAALGYLRNHASDLVDLVVNLPELIEKSIVQFGKALAQCDHKKVEYSRLNR